MSASLDIILVTGMSGSGKSVALRALEDCGYYCVDNLPPDLLMAFVTLERKLQINKVAIAIDVRSANSLHMLPTQLQGLRHNGVGVRSMFLDASTETLVHRFSETRRSHPLSKSMQGHTATDQHRALVDAIELERSMLADLRAQSQVMDTSILRASQLQAYIRDMLSTPSDHLTLVFESFSYKRGIPIDADFVFDVRMLPNPHYDPLMRELTGRDQPVIDYLRRQPEVGRMLAQIQQFVADWLPAMAKDNRSYVTVAIGCTGGQHRSVYCVEQLANHFAHEWISLKRHRELDAKQAPEPSSLVNLSRL